MGEEGRQQSLLVYTPLPYCSGFMTQYTPQAVTNGAVTEADLDVLLRRLFRVRIRLGQFDPPGPLSTIGPDQARAMREDRGMCFAVGLPPSCLCWPHR